MTGLFDIVSLTRNRRQRRRLHNNRN